MKWEHLERVCYKAKDSGDSTDAFACVDRCRVPGGWLVRTITASGVQIVYVPDARHEWDPDAEEL